ncbi:MAG: formyltransferase family protein [Gammaproteobacteria bacterium]
MKLTVLYSSTEHPVYPWLVRWQKAHKDVHDIELVSSTRDVSGGEILFLISFHEIVSVAVRERYSKTLVVHASDLPHGRGWSPHIWQILKGSNDITVTLLEAEDKIDSGAIWRKECMQLEGHELVDEINEKLFNIELGLMDFAVDNCSSITPQYQADSQASYYSKRLPCDSRLNPYKTIAEQFELLRVSDPRRFPAFIDYRGYRYKLTIEKIDKIEDRSNKGASE